MTELFAYQAVGVEFLAGRTRALLFDVPGLGKTAQGVCAIDDVMAGTGHAVVICPASIVVNWQREIAQWRKGGWTVDVLSYDRLVRGYELPDEFDCLILDEAHYCKSMPHRPATGERRATGSKRTKAALGLVARARYAWAFTGTPSPNGPHELYTLLRVFAPDVIRGKNGKIATYLQFMNRYCTTTPNPFGFYPKVTGGKNGPELKARLAPYMLRRTKKQVLKDLPPLVEANLFVSPLAGDIAAIRRAEAALSPRAIAAIEAGNLNVLDGEHIATLRRLTGMVKAGGVVDIVNDEIEGGLNKIVVFAYHRDVIASLVTGLEKHGLVQLVGGVSRTAKQEAIDRFQQDPNVKVFVGQITAAGVGITLTASQSAVFAEMSWVPAENEQAAQRIHRIGQKGSCLVRYAIMPNSLDERIVASLRRKMTAINAVFA